MSNLLSAGDLRTLMDDVDLRVVDVRFDLGDTSAGRAAYRQGHLPGALFFDLDEDLSVPPGEHGGRHPLPDMAAFASTLGERGIGNGHRVVAYDGSGGLFAGRLWWMLRYAGHDRVHLLDGGVDAWLEAGGGLSAEAPSYPRERFELRLRPDMVVDRGFVLRNLDNPDVLLVDARDGPRYRGETEPLDPVAGHIPSALNLSFKGNLDGGRFRDREALFERFELTTEAEEVVLYCGSGVSAAHNVLAMEEAGLPRPKLYTGSWSDWVSYADAPVATGDDDI
jgi:thiosulfate/3-mercaptopyruvate sulfurtransferase